MKVQSGFRVKKLLFKWFKQFKQFNRSDVIFVSFVVDSLSACIRADPRPKHGFCFPVLSAFICGDLRPNQGSGFRNLNGAS